MRSVSDLLGLSKAVVYLALVGVAAAALTYGAWQLRALQTENASLRKFKESVDRRDALAQEQDLARTDAAAASARARSARDVHAADRRRATEEASSDDPESAAFLRAPVPDRLRRADREAREARSQPVRDR